MGGRPEAWPLGSSQRWGEVAGLSPVFLRCPLVLGDLCLCWGDCSCEAVGRTDAGSTELELCLLWQC